MKIAFVAGKKSKDIIAIASAMEKTGSAVFFYLTGGKKIDVFISTLRAFIQGCDVIHYESKKVGYAGVIAKLLGRKTIIVSMDELQCPFVPKKQSVVKKNINAYSISKLGLRPKKYLLAEVDLVKAEGVHFLIDAFKQLENTAKTPNNFKLVVIAHEKKDEDYERYLRHICAGRQNIILLYDEPKGMLEMLYANAYLFVQTSPDASSIGRIMKARQHGLAVMANGSTENLEVLEESGVTFSLKNAGELSSKLAFLLIKNDEVERMGKISKKKLEKEYSAESIANKSVESYKLMYSKK
jgi:glycosyltransferase involved in cell wall biosynthesis